MIITKEETNPHNDAAKELDRVRTIADQGERWRAIRGFMWRLNPQTYTDDREFCAELKKERNAVSTFNPLAKSRKGHQRKLVSVPEYLYLALQVADPEFVPMQSGGKNSKEKDLWYKMWKIFPEYRVAEKR